MISADIPRYNINYRVDVLWKRNGNKKDHEPA
jgi:hypothetical protein